MANSNRKNTYHDIINYRTLNPAITAGSLLPLTTKGDIVAYDTGVVRKAVGTDDFVFTADSTNATGNAWKPIIGLDTRLNGHLYSRSWRPSGTNQSIPNNADTVVTFTNTSGESASPATRTGMYLISIGGQFDTSTAQKDNWIVINGTKLDPVVGGSGVTGFIAYTMTRYVPITAGQTIQYVVKQASGGALNFGQCWLEWVYLGKQ